MKKKSIILLFSFIGGITLLLILLGLNLDKSENEKQNGITNQYDISSQNTIAYVNYKDGKPSLMLYNKEKDINAEAFSLDSSRMILDPSFSYDGSLLSFISTNKQQDEDTAFKTTIHILDLSTKQVTDAFTENELITETEFSPVNDTLYYLRAGTFQNYSPIASKRPHDLDVWSFNPAEGEHKQITDLKSYSMHSLQLSPGENSVFIQMDDDQGADTPEETFEVKQRIFKIPIDNPDSMKIAGDPDRKMDVFDFTFSPDGDTMIFQSISNSDEGGTYEYELYKMDVDSGEEAQLTHLGEYTDRPVFSADGDRVYFMVDKRFAKGSPEYHLYSVKLNGKEIEKIELPLSED
ncbi:TolB family protein [Bacillus infantis]|uniref:TolB family protein n=1 Tax=Bacillus infantis TaxID=324767 RepID=UPI003CF65D40